MKHAAFAAAVAAAALANATPATAQVPSVAGVVVIREAGAAPNTARLGFVAGNDGDLVAYVGSTLDEQVVTGNEFVVRVSDGTEFVASGVAYDGATGLAMLRMQRPLPVSYRFAREPVATERLVYGATVDGDTGDVVILRGTVSGIDPALDTDPARPARISHNALVGERGMGSPLFNNCGQIVGVIVSDDANLPGVRGLAAPADWLERAFADESLVLARTDEACPSEVERLEAAEQARREADAERARAEQLRDEAEQARLQAEQAREQAEAQRDEAVTRATEREQDAAEAERRAAAAGQAATQAERARAAAAARAAGARRYMTWALAAGAVLSVLLALLWVVSRRLQARTRQAKLAAETRAEQAQDIVSTLEAREHDVRQTPDVFLTGTDQEGGKISLRIPGLSIAEPSGAIVGRNPFEGAFVLNREEVSRRHFRLFRADGVLMIEDLESMNGTEVDGMALKPGSRAVVRNGSRLGVGHLALAVRWHSPAEEPGEAGR